jgi:hypothetical protein
MAAIKQVKRRERVRINENHTSQRPVAPVTVRWRCPVCGQPHSRADHPKGPQGTLGASSAFTRQRAASAGCCRSGRASSSTPRREPLSRARVQQEFAAGAPDGSDGASYRPACLSWLRSDQPFPARASKQDRAGRLELRAYGSVGA